MDVRSHSQIPQYFLVLRDKNSTQHIGLISINQISTLRISTKNREPTLLPNAINGIHIHLNTYIFLLITMIIKWLWLPLDGVPVLGSVHSVVKASPSAVFP